MPQELAWVDPLVAIAYRQMRAQTAGAESRPRPFAASVQLRPLIASMH
jgi:hypothetical protein